MCSVIFILFPHFMSLDVLSVYFFERNSIKMRRFPWKSFSSRENCVLHNSERFVDCSQQPYTTVPSKQIWAVLQIYNGYCLCLRQDSKYMEIVRSFYVLWVDGKWKPLNCVLRMRDISSIWRIDKCLLVYPTCVTMQCNLMEKLMNFE